VSSSGDFLFSPLPYDPGLPESCLKHARKLQAAGTLRSAISECVPLEHQPKVFASVAAILAAGGKGALGNAIEAGHFYYRPNSSAKPDLGWAELKCTGLLPDREHGYRAKERLVICMINYGGSADSSVPCIVEESAEVSHAFRKLTSILLIFYDYVKYSDSAELLDARIREAGLWVPKPDDIVSLKQDWEVVRDYVKQGRAHELSEGLTPMLGACTKSSDSRVRVRQGYGSELAKPRAFALKQAFVTQIFRQLSVDQAKSQPTAVLSEPFSYGMKSKRNIEQVVAEEARRYRGSSTTEIEARLRLEGKFGGKSVHSLRMNKFVNTLASGDQFTPIGTLPDFRKSGLAVKVVRILQNGQAAESVSFPAFEYDQVAAEDEWEESSLYQDLVKRFLFVFLRDYKDGNPPVFDRAVFWSMPEDHLDLTKEVWADTVRLIRARRLEELPREAETYSVHVRPHDRRRFPGFKRSYWLNKSYVSSIWANSR
jgi:DNA mismatch repair protein MutH